jgi:DNA-binding IclR family transcriptional regulator
MDIGQITPGVNVVSAPVFNHHEKMIGCLILIGTFSKSTIKVYGPKVASTATQISYKLGATTEINRFNPLHFHEVGGP